METENKIKKAHTVQIGTKITVSGVNNVISMEDKDVQIALDGNTLILEGSGFSAEKLSIEEGILILSGTLSVLRYTHVKGKESLIKRFFK